MTLGGVMTEKQELTLSWRGGVGVFLGTILIGLLFYRFGEFDLARPTIFFSIAIIIAIAMRWDLRRELWFWIAMAVIVALHVPLILFVPWTTKWIPVMVIAPIFIGDFALITATIKVADKLMRPAHPAH
jgi:hypothetical protein